MSDFGDDSGMRDDHDRFNDVAFNRAIKNGAAGLIFFARSTKRILLGFRSIDVEKPHTWGGFGGARMMPDYPFDRVAQIEANEETGILSDQYQTIPVFVFRSATFEYHNFIGAMDEEFTPRLNWENEDAKWFDLDNLPEPQHPGLVQCLASPVTQEVLRRLIGEPINESDMRRWIDASRL